MEKSIMDALGNLEKEHDIKILLACETGSRAWGFPSPDSDFDVRFIYVYRKDWYLSLQEKKDTLEYMSEDRLVDMSGWELRKTLRLLMKSNVSVLERMQSQIIYKVDKQFVNGLNNVAQDCFSPIAVMHHYLSMSKSFLERVSRKETVRLKDYFYALRTAIAGKWIREKGTIPPLIFQEMFSVISAELSEKLDNLIALKATKDESYQHPSDAEIDEFLKHTINQNEALAQRLNSGNADWEKLDNFFRKWIK